MKTIPLNPKYLINEDGTRIVNELTGRTLKIGDQILKGKATGYKYVTLLFDDNYTFKRIAVHRLVAYAYLEDPQPNQIWVNHKDGNKSNNHYSNLEWVTIKDNIKHAYDNGLITVKSGSDHHRYGKKHNDKSKRKQSEAKKGDKHPKFTGYFVVHFKKYGSALEASKDTGYNSKTIYNRCKSGMFKPDFYFIPKKQAEIES